MSADSQKVEIEIQGDVSLSDLADICSALNQCLEDTARCIGIGPLDFDISDLRVTDDAK